LLSIQLLSTTQSSPLLYAFNNKLQLVSGVKFTIQAAAHRS